MCNNFKFWPNLYTRAQLLSLLTFLTFSVGSSYGAFPLFLPSCNESDIASNIKTTCFGIVEGLSFIVKCRFFPTKTSCFAVVMVGDTFRKSVTFVIN